MDNTEQGMRERRDQIMAPTGPPTHAVNDQPPAPVAATSTTVYTTRQTKPPLAVGTERGVLAGVVVALLTGALDILRSHQIGYSWADSVESGLILAIPLLIGIAGSFTTFAAIDQYGRARKEG